MSRSRDINGHTYTQTVFLLIFNLLHQIIEELCLGESLSECSLCGKTFASQSGLWKHKITLHKEMSENELGRDYNKAQVCNLKL